MGAEFDYHTCGKMTPDEVKAKMLVSLCGEMTTDHLR